MINTGDTMKKTIFESLLNEKIIIIKKLDQGISNHNYYLQTQNHQYIARVPKNPDIHDYHLEMVITDLVNPLQINSDTVVFDTNSGIKISRFIENIQTFDQYHQADRITAVVDLMKTLHQAQLQCGTIFDHSQRLLAYKNQIRQPLYQTNVFETILDTIKNYRYTPILCHNDWVAGNICFTKNKHYLIDYEYASDNDPLFDVMSFLTENQLTSSEINTFLNLYFDNQHQNYTPYLQMWEQYHNLLWLYWANMMYDKTQEVIFLQIAQDKYQALHQPIIK